MKILVVEDNRDQRNILKRTLENELFTVDTASDGKEGSYLARTNSYQAILLDNILPYKNGHTVCTEIRANGIKTPIILLSVKGDIDEKIRLIEAGADDYLQKPYSYKELLARLKSVIRRSEYSPSVKLSAKNIVLDTNNQKVTKNGIEIHLTKKQFSLLEFLLKNKGKIVSRELIFENVWDQNGDPFSNTFDTHMRNLKHKIEEKDEIIIENIHGRGYRA